MSYLLDTHTLLWALSDKSKLSKTANQIIQNTTHTICVSAVNFWEVSLKLSIGKLDINGFSVEELPALSLQSGFTIIPLLPDEAASYHKLPVMDGHKDPFDRMLIWQALQQGLILISKDVHIARYTNAGLKVLW